MFFIQSHPDNKTIAYNIDNSLLQYQAISDGFDVKLISANDISDLDIDTIKNNIFSGSVEFMRLVFDRLNLDPRLPMNSNRSEYISTLGDIKARAKNGEKIFIKPVQIKLFTGFVIDKSRYPEIDKLSDETLVIYTTPFEQDIISEFRVYIHRNKVIHIGNYSGDLFTAIDEQYLYSVIDDNKTLDFPQTYTIDIGILEDGQNVVIEFNDMWAIGNYGVSGDDYLDMIAYRYKDIIKCQ